MFSFLGLPSGMAVSPFSPARLGPLTLRNRLIKCATFEGRTPDALVTDDLVEFHREIAAGGVAMTTVAYLAISPEGRTDRHQIWLRQDAAPGLRRLTDAIHAEGALASAQIGHAGPVANPLSNRARALAPSRIPAPMGVAPSSMAVCRRPSTEEIAGLMRTARHGARIAVDSGFDALEIHFGHNYLASSFLSPLLNRRKDAYGGSVVARARFAREMAQAVREEVGDSVAVLAKLNMYDGVPGGFMPDDACTVAQLLERDGHLDAIEPTAGSSLLNPMYLFHGDAPRAEFAATFHGVLRWGLTAAGPFFLKKYPYRPAYLLPLAQQLREAVSMPLILLGGVTDRASMDLALAEGFDFVAMGRALLREPDLPLRIEADPSTTSRCIHCNRCMPTIYTRTRCPLRPETGPLVEENATITA